VGNEYFRLEGRRSNYERDKDGAEMVRDKIVQETVFLEHEVQHQAT
jgi:hypothetical protein